MAVRRWFVKILLSLLVLQRCAEARPTKGNDKVTMSGEPTHFQVDDKAAELEINANAMGVKVNAKPASLQVVSKPGAPAMAIPHPAVYAPPDQGYHMAPYYPAPYYPAPMYPSPILSAPAPMVLGHRRTVRRRHHFFDVSPSTENWNFKKEKIPRKGGSLKNSKKDKHIQQISKKSEISKSEASKNSKDTRKTENKSRKRQWIQQVPVLAQVVSYNTIPIRVHPLVQRLFASPAAMRNTVPRPMYGLSQQTFSPLSQKLSYISPGLGEASGAFRSSIHRSIFLPALPGYQNMQTLSPLAVSPLRQPWSNPSMLHAPLPGYNGYYDPILTRDFIPDFSNVGFPRVEVPTPRGMIPNGIPGGLMYPGYTPLGMFSKNTEVVLVHPR